MGQMSTNPTLIMRVARVASAINLLLAANFYAFVPFLGWLNYGHGGTAGWIPDVILVAILPGAYFVYWHFGALIALLALFVSHSLWLRSRAREAAILSALNAATLVLYVAVRIAFALLRIHPDSV
jgi:integral membrane sensor domain MASE1